MSGKTAWAALSADSNNLYGELILNALPQVHPATLTPLAGRAYPVQLTLTNEGIAIPGRVQVSLPPTVTALDAGGATVSGNMLTWPFDLAVNETQLFTAWLALPESTVHVDVLIQVGLDPNYTDHTTALLDITPQIETRVEDALTALQTLDSKQYKQVKKYLEWAQNDEQAGDYAQAVAALTRAADALIKIGTPESDTVRALVAEILRNVSRQI